MILLEKKPVKETFKKLYLLIVDRDLRELTTLFFVFSFSGKLSRPEILNSCLNPLKSRSDYSEWSPCDKIDTQNLEELLQHSDYSTRQNFGQKLVFFWIRDPYFMCHKQVSKLQRNSLAVIRRLLDQNLIVLSETCASLFFEHLSNQLDFLVLTPNASLILEVINEVLSLEILPPESLLYLRVKSKVEKIEHYRKVWSTETYQLEQNLGITHLSDNIGAKSSFLQSSPKKKSKEVVSLPKEFEFSQETQKQIKILQFNL